MTHANDTRQTGGEGCVNMENETQNKKGLGRAAADCISLVSSDIATALIIISLVGSCSYVHVQEQRAQVEIEKIRADKDKNNK